MINKEANKETNKEANKEAVLNISLLFINSTFTIRSILDVSQDSENAYAWSACSFNRSFGNQFHSY